MSDRVTDTTELSPSAEAAWNAFAISIEPDHGAAARVLQRVNERTSSPRRIVPDDLEEPASESPTARRAAAAVLVAKSSAITVGLAGGALLSIKLIVAAVRPAAPSLPPVDVPAPVLAPATASRAPIVPSPPPSSLPAVVPNDPLGAPVLTPVSPASPAKPRPGGPAPSVSPDLLQAELELMERARAAVRAGEHARAIDLLESHRTGFPNGGLVEERLAWHAIAACELGRADGSERAKRFASTYPRSSQLAAVRVACGLAIEAMDPPARQQ